MCKKDSFFAHRERLWFDCAMSPTDDVARHISQGFDTLTPQQRRAARFLLDHPTEVARSGDAALAAIGASEQQLARFRVYWSDGSEEPQP